MASPKYTEQQAAAIQTRDVSIALSAGAGCGKTFVLTQRFLRQLEPGPHTTELSALVAITFTDRAAREMRDRVREACQQRVQQCPPDEVEHWLTVLRGLDNARISTIHAFCTSLLKSNAIEARLDPRFAVLEPPLADALLEEAAESVIHGGLIADEPATTAFVLRFGLERTREIMATLARQRFRVDWSRWENAQASDLADEWQRLSPSEFAPHLILEVRTGRTAEKLRQLIRDYRPDHAEMLRRWGILAAGLQPDATWSEPVAQLHELREVARVQGGGTKKHWPSEDVFEVVKETLQQFRKELDGVLDLLEYDPASVALAAEFSCHAWQLAGQVAQQYETLKSQAGSLDFDDLLLQARNLLRDVPNVRARAARGIRMLMVDEFQDTDPVQAEIVRFLCGEELTRGKLFLVGDIKQSIYRFRRADPQVFRSLRSELPAAGQLSLTRNFRSQPAILNFVNALFQDEFADYEALEPFDPRQHSPLPSIEFLFADHDADPASRNDSGQDDSGKASVHELRQREADWMARRIVELLNDDTPRIRKKNRETGHVELRRVQLGDITILFRALSNVQEYEAALRRYGLDYYLVGGKAFFAQQEVFDLLNLCQCLDNPDDEIALIGVLRSPFFGLSDDALQALHLLPGAWWEKLEQPPPAMLPDLQQERIRFAGRTLHALRTSKDHLSIAELLTDAIARTGYDASLLAEFLGNRKIANLRKLIDQAETFDRSDRFTLQDYIQRLQTSVLEEEDEEFATTLPETGNVIRLMSVHQSKGLEFPVVIVADVNRATRPGGTGVYLHPEWGALVKLPDRFGVAYEHLALRMLKIVEAAAEAEETQRLFYVAVTRAADHLILSTGLEPDRGKFSPWMQLLSERFDLLTGLPVGDPLTGALTGISDRTLVPEIRVHHRPPVAQPVSQSRPRSLSTFWPSLWEATPAPLPESMQVFASDRTALRTWSVSTLEEIDAILRPQPHPFTPPAERVAIPRTAAEELGHLVHSALEVLDFSDPESWPAAVELARRMQRKSPETEVVRLTQDIVRRFAGSELAVRCASARQLFREVDFAFPWPLSQDANGSQANSVSGDLIAGQIDLCLESATGAWEIYDFKTVDDRQQHPDELHLAPYSFQLGIYALAIEAWLQREVSTVSLILLRPQLREVPLRWTTELRAQTISRLTAALEQARQLPAG